MKIILALLFSALFCTCVAAQTDEEKTADKSGVEEISLMHATSANGKLSDAATEFSTTDVPIYCAVALASVKVIAVKMNFIAVSAAGLKANSVVVSVNYKTNGKENGVTFNASPNGKVWAAGKYRVDVLLDGKTAKSLEFEIKKSANEIAKEKTPPSSKAKPKPRPRKN